jgi:hypothetical protein
VKTGISGAVGIGKTAFIDSLDGSIFLKVEEAARQVNAMYPDKDNEELRELIFHHQFSVEEVVNKINEDLIAIFDRTIIDNIVFMELFAGKELAESRKNFVKTAYLRGFKKYDALYYFDYGSENDPQLLKRMLSDPFRKKTLGEFAEIGKFIDFNKRFKAVFLRTADEFGLKVEVIETDFNEFSLKERNEMLSNKILNNFLGV